MLLSPLNQAREKIACIANDWFGVKPLAITQSNIEAWFKTDLGQRILAAEQKCLDQIMLEMYGYHLMKLSVLSDNYPLSRQSPVTHHFSLDVNQSQLYSDSGAIAHFEHLPIQAESIDTALLHHVLDYSVNPHQLLRETARTVIPNGYIIIIGFNPYGLLTLKKHVGLLLTKRAHWRYHSLRSSRLVDWLRVLDFEPALIQYGYHGLPMGRAYHDNFDSLCGRILPVTGTFYMIVARKSVVPMTIIKKPWKKTNEISNWSKGPVVQQAEISPSLVERNNSKEITQKIKVKNV